MPNFYNKYPYTDFHELNLDWVLEQVKTNTETVEQNVQENQQFKEDLTQQQTNFERGMNDWKGDTETALNGWKHDTEEAYQGQIDTLEQAYDDFLDNYSRTFGIVDAYGNSAVDAISQAKATETNDRLNKVVNYPLNDFLADYQFSRGSIASDGSLISVNYRIYSTDILTAGEDMIIKTNTGWKFGLSFYTGSVFDSGTGLDADDKTITAGQNYRISICRETENPLENAVIKDFMAGVYVMARTSSYNSYDKINNVINDYIKCDSGFEFGVKEFDRGTIDSAGTYNNAVQYRIATPSPLTRDHDIIISAASGYEYKATFYSGGVFVSGTPFGVDPIIIPANTEFGITIREAAEDPGSTANPAVFIHGIEVITPQLPIKPVSSYINVTNKIINFLGDSYVDNHNDPFEYTWCYKFAVKHNDVVRNYGMDGTTITPQADGGSAGSISDRAVYMAAADYIVVIGGKNDYNAQIPLTTFRTAVSNLIEYLVANFPTSQICFFTPWKVTEATEADIGAPTRTIPLFDYIDIILEECASHGMACYNTKDSGIYTFDATFRATYFQSVNDASHLNNDGHDLFLPRAEKFLMTVLR